MWQGINSSRQSLYDLADIKLILIPVCKVNNESLNFTAVLLNEGRQSPREGFHILYLPFSGVIGCGYFCIERFPEEVCDLVSKLVSCTRILWQKTKVGTLLSFIQAPSTLLRFRYDPFLLHGSYLFTVLRLYTKWRENIRLCPFLSVNIHKHSFLSVFVRFCPFTLIHMITNMQPRISIFVRFCKACC